MFTDEYVSMTFSDFGGLMLGFVFWATLFLMFFKGIERLAQAISKKNG